MSSDGKDRRVYLEEQVERQRRGEPIDVEWVRAELERVRHEQDETHSRTRKRLLVVTIVSAVLLLVLWIRNGGLHQQNGPQLLCVIVVAALGIWSLRRRR